MVNSSQPVTVNKAIKKPGSPSENSPGFSFQRINDGLDQIDGFIDALEEAQDTLSTEVAEVQDEVDTEEIARADEDKKQDFTKTFDNPTYDGSGRITAYTEGNVAVSNIVRNGSSGKIETWTETVILNGGSQVRNYTATYDGSGRNADVTYTVV